VDADLGLVAGASISARSSAVRSSCSRLSRPASICVSMSASSAVFVVTSASSAVVRSRFSSIAFWTMPSSAVFVFLRLSRSSRSCFAVIAVTPENSWGVTAAVSEGPQI
jgi:hypothetical protein